MSSQTFILLDGDNVVSRESHKEDLKENINFWQSYCWFKQLSWSNLITYFTVTRAHDILINYLIKELWSILLIQVWFQIAAGRKKETRIFADDVSLLTSVKSVIVKMINKYIRSTANPLRYILIAYSNCYYIKWVTTSWTNRSILHWGPVRLIKAGRLLFNVFVCSSPYLAPSLTWLKRTGP